MRVENFFEQGIAEALKHSGCRELIPLEISASELISIFEGKNYRVIDPKAHSNVVKPFIHDGIGRYAVLRDPKDPDNLDLEVLMVVTKIDEAGVEGLPYVFDRDLDKLKEFVFE